MAKRKSTNNDLQNITQETKDGVTRTTLKTNNDLQNTTGTFLRGICRDIRP
jgi:hypothetical protein